VSIKHYVLGLCIGGALAVAATASDVYRMRAIQKQEEALLRRQMSCYLAASIALASKPIIDPGFRARYERLCSPDSLRIQR
jgi:hypothetical protein